MITRLYGEDEKRKEILENSSQSCMVEAGAGAGKTTIIKKRVASQLKEGKLKPSELVVITFTKAAAGELRDRISKELEDEYKLAKNEKEKNNLKNAIENQSMIQISTIHSFCFRLLEERALDTCLPLDIKMLEESDNKERIDSFFKKWYKEQRKEEIISLHKEFYLKDYSKYVYECFKEICDLPDDMEFKYYDNLLNSLKLKDYISKIKKQCDKLFSEIISIINASDDTVNTIEEAFNKGYIYVDIKNLYKGINSKNLYTSLEAYKNVSKKDVYFLSSLEKDEGFRVFKSKSLKSYNDHIYEMVKDEENISIKLNLYQNALVLYLALKARDDYNRELEKGENRHFVSNDQLLKMALKLVDNEDALIHFQNEFKYIYVDEFQDTDTVQRDLVYKLVTDINTKKFKDSSFFLVGDPKQSIYAFRGADLEVYKDTKNHLMDESIKNVYVYELQRNHRSDPKIIDWVNREFENGEYGLGDLYLKMTCKHEGKSAGDILSGVYTLDRAKAPVPKELKVKKKDLIARESYFLPRFIELIRKHYKINVYDKSGSVTGKRDISYADFLVLSKNKDVLEDYADSLKSSGIPVNLYGALDLESDAVVLRFKALIHFLVNPYDEKAKYGAMEVLARSLITCDNEEDAKCMLDEFSKVFSKMSAYAKVEYLAHHIEYFVDDVNNKATLDYIQSSLQQLLEYLLGNGICTLSKYDELIDKYIASGIDKSLSLTRDENAVRLMNLHKSKGLEGKIVIILARGKDKNDSDDSYRRMYEYFPSVKMFGKTIPSYSKQDGAILNADVPKKARYDEYKRLEYVEATRAEEALIFFDNNAKGSSLFDKFDFTGCINLTTINSDIKSLYQDVMILGKMEDVKTCEKEVKYALDNFDIVLDDNQKMISYTNSSPSEYEKYDEEWAPIKENRPRGRDFGTIMHRVFELACMCIKEGKNIIKSDIINQSILESYNVLKERYNNVESYIDFLKEYLNKELDIFLKSTLMEKILKAKEIYPEYKFNFFVSDDMKEEDIFEKGTLWLNGKVDLVLVNDDNIEIYDYKTDVKGDYSIEEFNDHLEHIYSSQQKLYCFAISKCFKKDISKIRYYFYHLYE